MRIMRASAQPENDTAVSITQACGAKHTSHDATPHPPETPLGHLNSCHISTEPKPGAGKGRGQQIDRALQNCRSGKKLGGQHARKIGRAAASLKTWAFAGAQPAGTRHRDNRLCRAIAMPSHHSVPRLARYVSRLFSTPLRHCCPNTAFFRLVSFDIQWMMGWKPVANQAADGARGQNAAGEQVYW